MPAILFTCPSTRERVQHWVADDPDAVEDDFESADCNACGKVHFINRQGEVLGASGDDQ
jgi:hypothetical protein